ncbi:MAG TPA: hypothetical protein VND64_25820 [Pirellulales bacterium]|nr:hypothetical protein [Pirellulales bacterium]
MDEAAIDVQHSQLPHVAQCGGHSGSEPIKVDVEKAQAGQSCQSLEKLFIPFLVIFGIIYIPDQSTDDASPKTVGPDNIEPFRSPTFEVDASLATNPRDHCVRFIGPVTGRGAPRAEYCRQAHAD